DLDVGGDAIAVFAREVGGLQAAAALAETPFHDAPVQRLDCVFGKGLAAEHDLEAVVVGWIVAAGHRNPGTAADVLAREIRYRRRRHADVDHVHARRAQAVDQRGGHVGTRHAPVAADHDVTETAFAR